MNNRITISREALDALIRQGVGTRYVQQEVDGSLSIEFDDLVIETLQRLDTDINKAILIVCDVSKLH